MTHMHSVFLGDLSLPQAKFETGETTKLTSHLPQVFFHGQSHGQIAKKNVNETPQGCQLNAHFCHRKKSTCVVYIPIVFAEESPIFRVTVANL